MAELVFFSGTMDCGKSTLALQLAYNHQARGRAVLVCTAHDRTGPGQASSRLGLSRPAVEVGPTTDVWETVVGHASAGRAVDVAVCDEAQFYTATQVEQLARLVDHMGLDVFAFGITTDFRTRLFPGSQRLIELADRVELLQVEALCWCGRRATHNARVVAGQMVVEGEQVLIGDMAVVHGTDETDGTDRAAGSRDAAAADADPTVEYEVLCRRHHRARLTARVARTGAMSPDVLPF